MSITTSKLTTLAQLKLQAERVKTEFGKYTKTADLGALALKSEIAQADLSTELAALINGKLNSADAYTAEQAALDIAAAVASGQKAIFEKVANIPEAESAQENVMYLVPNSKTKHYDIYMKIKGDGDTYTMELIDDTTVDLSGYATTEAMNTAIAAFIKLTDLSAEVSGDGNAITGVAFDNTTGKFTFTKGATFLTAHPTVTKTSDTTSTGSVNSTENTVEVIDSVVRDEFGHVTAINTKTVTLGFVSEGDIPVATDSEVTTMLTEVFGA